MVRKSSACGGTVAHLPGRTARKAAEQHLNGYRDPLQIDAWRIQARPSAEKFRIRLSIKRFHSACVFGEPKETTAWREGSAEWRTVVRALAVLGPLPETGAATLTSPCRTCALSGLLLDHAHNWPIMMPA